MPHLMISDAKAGEADRYAQARPVGAERLLPPHRSGAIMNV